MCTMSIIPTTGGGFRVVINRDELRTRPKALRPAVVDLEAGVCAAWPTDAQAGGTWIAVSDYGLVLGLLNGNPTPMPTLPDESELSSRGLIIPSLIRSGSAIEAAANVAELDSSRYAPFRLVAVDRAAIVDVSWDRVSLRISRTELKPACFVSSGLGDRKVAPRLGLFRRWMAAQGATIANQDAFHQHRWDDRPEISIHMSRPEARTVSITRVEVNPDRTAVMTYEDDAGAHTVRVPPAQALPARGARTVGGRVPC